MDSPLLVFAFILVLVFGFVVFFGAPYVPSHKKYVKRAFDHFEIGPDDMLVDVGSGDGIILRIASRYGAQAVGYEINPILVAVAQLLSLGDARVRVRLQNAWRAKLPVETTIVYAFAVSRDEKKLTTLMQREANRLQKPLRLLCYASPFKAMKPYASFEAYGLYVFQPLQSKNA